MAESDTGEKPYLPRLSVAEWTVFGVLAAALAVTNVYSVLLTAWGSGGSILGVIGSVLGLGLLGRAVKLQRLNLGQTMISAGASVGFAVASYASLKLAVPAYSADPLLLIATCVGVGVVGVLFGTTLRRSLVRFYFPSGTACAIIQRAVTRDADAGRRPVRLLVLWGAVSAVATIPTKIAGSAGGAALLSRVPLGTVSGTPLGIALEPIYYGIGLIVGPRIGLGMLLGGLIAPFGLMPWLDHRGVPEAARGDWLTWMSIAMLALPTFASLLFSRLYRAEPPPPPGFADRPVDVAGPPRRAVLYSALALAGALVLAIGAYVAFDVPWYLTIVAVAVCWPLAAINGRIMADTDINPVLLSVFILLTLLAVLGSSGPVPLLGAAILCSFVVGLATDLVQDYRTGHLIGANPTHQTTVQMLGMLVGVAAAVPFVLLLDARLGFGETGLAAPGARIYAHLALGLAGEGTSLGGDLLTAVVLVSVAGSVYAFFAAWPRTARHLPSLFGLGIGMLLPIDASAAIFAGGLLRWGLERWAQRREAAATIDTDIMLAGSAVFAASAILTVALLLAVEVLAQLGWHPFYLAG